MVICKGSNNKLDKKEVKKCIEMNIVSLFTHHIYNTLYILEKIVKIGVLPKEETVPTSRIEVKFSAYEVNQHDRSKVYL